MGENAAEPGSTASNLLEQVKANVGPAWQRLAALYAPLVYSWARCAGLQAEDAADVVQEVFRAVLTHIADYESGPRPVPSAPGSGRSAATSSTTTGGVGGVNRWPSAGAMHRSVC